MNWKKKINRDKQIICIEKFETNYQQISLDALKKVCEKLESLPRDELHILKFLSPDKLMMLEAVYPSRRTTSSASCGV